MCGPEGERVLIFDCIVDFKRDRNVMTLTDEKFFDSCGKSRNYRSTKGWKICCQWKEVSASLEELYYFKNYYPVHTSEYSITQGIEHKPVFNWWVRHTLKKDDCIISLVQKQQTRYLKKTQHFWIELPNTVAEAQDLDKNNGKTLWYDAITK